MKEFKKCRGTGKALGFGCGVEVPVVQFGKANRVYGLGKSCGCYGSWLINSEEGKKKIANATLKVTEPRRSLEKAIEEKDKSKGLQIAIKQTKDLVHKMVRLRDKGKPCITCGCQWRKNFEAGHCYPTRYNSIRFEFHNINGQCMKCNRTPTGMNEEYVLLLPQRIGEEEFKKLQRKAELDKKFTKKWTREELLEIREEAKKIINEYQKGNE